jgi:PAS domain S-box-containing protein
LRKLGIRTLKSVKPIFSKTMKYISEKKVTLFYYVSASVLLAVLAIFYINSQKVKSTNALVEHTQVVLARTADLLLDVLNIETGVRGYLLTGEEKFLEPYNSSLTTIGSNLTTLVAFTKNDTSQKVHIDSLKILVEARLLLAKNVIETRKNNELKNIAVMPILEEGKTRTDKIRHMILLINEDEYSLQKLRKIENETSNRNTPVIFLLLLLLIAGIFTLLIIIRKEQKYRNNELEILSEAQKSVSQYSRSLIEASLDPLVTISAEGKITDVNEASIKVTGLRREALIDSDFSNYFTDPAKARQGYQLVFEKGFVSDYSLTIKSKTGKLTDVLYNASLYKDAVGNVLGVFAAARDVTEQNWIKDLRIANKELAFQNEEKEKRAAELVIANKELAFQNEVKENRAAELVIANKELAFQNEEKEKRAAELVIANKELAFQSDEKENRAAELIIADKELEFQNKEKEKQQIVNKELEALSYSAKLASQYSLSLIEASRDPLFTISPAGKITDLNNASVMVTGVARKNLIGSDFFNYFTEPDAARKGYEEVFANGFVTDYPLTIMDGELTDVLFNGSVYKDDRGNEIGAVMVARDITVQKRISKELNEAIIFAELATGIAEDAKLKAEKATRIAEDAVKAKQQFLSNMSHEIRTPMNAIIGFTKVVLKTELTVKQKEYLNAIKQSGNSLIVLINDILDLAKVDAGKMTFEKIPFKLESSISSMIHLFETKIEEKNLKLVKEYDTKIPAVLLGDPVRLHQIILNLVSNAVKFTNKGKITIAIRRLADEDDGHVKIEFAISDTGIGISENKMESIFENFQQASSGTSRLYGGTGLGLAIVKQLVEAQGGTIEVDSIIDVGSTFRFTLNFQKTNEAAESDTELIELDTELKHIKVLVVEDMALNQLLMKTLLDDFGFERDIAANGKIAIEKLAEKDYDIILMDLQMPEMNGFEATEHIRNKMKSNIPIIALTADVTTVDLAKCKAVGMNDYIAKPVDERVLYSKIIGLVKKPVQKIYTLAKVDETLEASTLKCTDLAYLIGITKNDPKLMMEMISIYLEQTPLLVEAMKQGMLDKDWDTMHAAAHKMIPSFAIMGISHEFEIAAKKIQAYTGILSKSNEIEGLVMQLENICLQACKELKEEYNTLKYTNS